MTQVDLDAAQARVIARATEVLSADDRIRAVFLVGSHAAGWADTYSDVDVHCLVDDAVDLSGDLPRLAEELVGPTVLIDRIPGVPGVLAITPDWLHLDLIVHRRGDEDWRRYPALRPLSDPEGLLTPRTPDLNPGGPSFPDATVRLFYYFLGNLVTVLGRDELVIADAGVLVLRERLVELLCAETGVNRAGGMKRLNRFLTADQRAVLEGVPAAGADRARILAANRYITRQFVSRGRALARRLDVAWPQDLHDATVAHLRRHLGVDFDVVPRR